MTFRGSIYVILAILLVTIISAFEDKETKIGKETPSGEETLPFGEENISVPSFNETLLFICAAVGTPAINCTCQNPDVKVLCDKLRPEHEPILQYDSCNKEMMHLRGYGNCIISTIGILGNILVVAVSLRYYFMITRCNLLITILAVTDLSTSSIRLWRNFPNLWTCNWVYNRFSCTLGHGVLNAASYISMGLIVMIAVERYLGIVHPFYRGISNMKLAFMLILNVGIGLSIASPIFMYTDLADNLCTELWPSEDYAFYYGVVILVLFSILPAVVIGFIYYKIILTLRQSTKKLFRTSAVSFSTETKRIKDNERIMTMVITISLLFVVLVFPNRIFLIARGIMSIRGIEPPKEFFFTQVVFAYIVYSLHAVVNPIIYSLMDRVFRKKVIHILTCQRITGNRTDFLRTSTCTKTSRRLTRTSNISSMRTTKSSVQQEENKIHSQQLTVTSEM